MNHQIYMLLTIWLLISPTIIIGAPRSSTSQQRSHQRTEQNNTAPQQVMMIPVSLSAKQPNLPQNQQDREFFLTLLSIAANFGNILLNKENKPVVIHNVSNMINSIVQAADIITKYQKRGISPDQLREILSCILSDQAQNISHIRI